MKACLILVTADGRRREFPIRKPKVVIGRELRCDLRIALPSVEARHCEIHFDERNLELVDLKSNGGTYHNGERVERAVLASNDQLKVGSTTFVVHIEADDERVVGHVTACED